MERGLIIGKISEKGEAAMGLNRREFLKASGVVWGTAVLGAGISTLTAQES